MKLQQEFIDTILDAPDSQLDESVFEDIKGWNLEPTSLDILFVLDKIVYASLGSEFTVTMFGMLLAQSLIEEKMSMDELLSQRDWTSPEFERNK